MAFVAFVGGDLNQPSPSGLLQVHPLLFIALEAAGIERHCSSSSLLKFITSTDAIKNLTPSTIIPQPLWVPHYYHPHLNPFHPAISSLATSTSPLVGNQPVFQLSMTPEAFFIDGINILTARSKQLFALMKILFFQYLHDLEAGCWQEHFTLLDLETIASRMPELVDDIGTLRRYLQRLQDDINELLKEHLNQPIARDSIIQSVLLKGARKRYGYRLNPATLSIRPLNLSEI